MPIERVTEMPRNRLSDADTREPRRQLELGFGAQVGERLGAMIQARPLRERALHCELIVLGLETWLHTERVSVTRGVGRRCVAQRQRGKASADARAALQDTQMVDESSLGYCSLQELVLRVEPKPYRESIAALLDIQCKRVTCD